MLVIILYYNIIILYICSGATINSLAVLTSQFRFDFDVSYKNYIHVIIMYI